MPQTLTARTLITDTAEIPYPRITHQDGQILTIEPGPQNDSTTTLTAPFLDIHVHGAMGHDFMAATPAEITQVGRFLATRGVAHYLPTTVTGPIDATLRALATLAGAVEQAPQPLAASPAGIHLEGPFLAHSRRGVQPAASLLTPSIPLFDRFQQAARGHIRLITLAPELPGALDLIQHAIAAGVRVSVGHSDATAAQTLAAIAAGASSATHTFNAMRPLDHREPGILGTVLDQQALYAELIADGIHVAPAMVRLWLRAKGSHHAILVTDGISATGMPDGLYTLGDFPVQVTGGVCRTIPEPPAEPDPLPSSLFPLPSPLSPLPSPLGALAGSVLTMDAAVRNLQRFTGTPLATAVHLASRNPAAMLGLTDLTTPAPGRPATFNLFDQAGTLTGTLLRGQPVPRP